MPDPVENRIRSFGRGFALSFSPTENECALASHSCSTEWLQKQELWKEHSFSYEKVESKSRCLSKTTLTMVFWHRWLRCQKESQIKIIRGNHTFKYCAKACERIYEDATLKNWEARLNPLRFQLNANSTCQVANNGSNRACTTTGTVHYANRARWVRINRGRSGIKNRTLFLKRRE